MSRKRVLLMALILLIPVLLVTSNVHRVEAAGTIYIRADGSIDPPTANITSVDNVTYTFTDNIFDEIVVERDNIVVDGAGHILQGAGEASSKGIDLSSRSNVTIKNVEIKTFHYGIYLSEGSSNNTISGNSMTNNSYSGVTLGTGIPSNNNTISGNDITNNGMYGVSLGYGTARSNIISGNNITNNDFDGIFLWGPYADNNIISGNNIISNGDTCVDIAAGSNNVISGNNLANSVTGVALHSPFNTVSGNNIANNSYYGVWIPSFSNIISGNNITRGARCGVSLLSYFGNNTVSGNNITDNGDAGIFFNESGNNTITGNNLAYNRWGVSFSLHSSSGQVLYHNNFVDNDDGTVSLHPNYALASVWDDGYPSGGNYWSDYEEKYPGAGEIDSSGIWDTPYEVDENNQDNYPLMNPWGVIPPPPDTTPPTISIISPENKTYAVSEVPLTFTVSETTSWIGRSLNGGGNVTIYGNTTLTGLTDGTYTLVVYARDATGNEGSSEMVYFTIQTPAPDTTPPVIFITSPENRTYSCTDGCPLIALTFTVDESVSWMGYSLDSQANVTVAGDTTLSGLSDGSHTITVYANDTAGNMGSSETVHFTIQTLTLDTTPPNISVLSPEIKTYATADVSLTFTVDESVSWMAYSLDGQANVTLTGNMTISGLSDGSHSLIVYARDAAGNTGASGTISFTIETPTEPPPSEPFNPLLIIAAAVVIVGGAVTAFLVFWLRSKK